jgi:hypothetical protein
MSQVDPTIGRHRHFSLVAMAVIAAGLAVAGCKGSSTAASTTSLAPSTGPPPTGPATVAPVRFTYHVVPASILFDAATKVYTIPMSIHNPAGRADAPWCDASIDSGPSSPIGITGPLKFGRIAANGTATITIKVTLNVAGTPRQAEALCASSQSAANNSYSWSTASLAVAAPAHGGVTLRTVCLDVNAFAGDVLKFQNTATLPPGTDNTARAMTAAANKYGAPYAAEVQAEGKALRSYTASVGFTNIDNDLSKIDNQCVAHGI